MTQIRINGVDEEIAASTVSELLPLAEWIPPPGSWPSPSTVPSSAVLSGRRQLWLPATMSKSCGLSLAVNPSVRTLLNG